MIYTSFIDTPLGVVTATAEDNALIGLWFVGQKYYPAETSSWLEKSGHNVFEDLRVFLADYFAGKKPGVKIKLAPKGTDFQKMVWEMLLKIPFGRVTTYGALAAEAAKKKGLASMSAQAVGGAVGHNPISILIPCHRVLGAKGALTGYAGGLDKKRALLKLEGADLSLG